MDNFPWFNIHKPIIAQLQGSSLCSSAGPRSLGWLRMPWGHDIGMPVCTCFCLWNFYGISMNFYEFLWISMDISMDFYGFLWISMDFYVFLWISMNFYGISRIQWKMNDWIQWNPMGNPLESMNFRNGSHGILWKIVWKSSLANRFIGLQISSRGSLMQD